MPTVCTYKPRRSHPRRYSYQDAARVLCYASFAEGAAGRDALRADAQGPGIEATIRIVSNLARQRCGDERGRPRRAAEEALSKEAQQEAEVGALESAIGNVQNNETLLEEILTWISTIVTVLTALGLVLRFVPHPAAKLASVASIRLLTRVTAFRGAIVARKAANDAVYQRLNQTLEILRRAA